MMKFRARAEGGRKGRRESMKFWPWANMHEVLALGRGRERGKEGERDLRARVKG